MEQKPQIPTLKDSRKIQIRGLASGLSLGERLRQFKKKDLAFILAGLGVLFMAPLAEHFMMSPESADSSSFKPGWGFQPSRGFGDGGSPYESGVNGMAPGGAVGGGGDVITPLNVRDPSALVMGPAAQQQPAATSTIPPPAKESTDWKDAIANAASKGAGAATKAASLPVPKAALTNAGLRGLGAVSGGGGAGYSLPPISAANVPNKAAESGSLQRVTAAPGYRGAGPRGAQNASAGAMEALKKAAANAGSDFNRTGPAANALEAAAAHQMPTGGSSGEAGGGGSGREDKGPGGGQDKSSKSLGESLEFLAMKDEQQKARDLKWELKKKDALMWPNLKEKLIEEAVSTPMKGLTASISDLIKDWGGDKTKAGTWICKGQKVAKSKVGKCYATGDDAKPFGLFYNEANRNIYSDPKCTGEPSYQDCTSEGDSSGGGKETEGGTENILAQQGGEDYHGRDLAAVCRDITGYGKIGATGTALLGMAKKTVEAYNAMSGGNNAWCGADAIITEPYTDQVAGSPTVKKLHKKASQDMAEWVNKMEAALGKAAGATQLPQDEMDRKKKELDTQLVAEKYNKETAEQAADFGDGSLTTAQSNYETADGYKKTADSLLPRAEGFIKDTDGYLGAVAKKLDGLDKKHAGLKDDVERVQRLGNKDAVDIWDNLGTIISEQQAALKKNQGVQENLENSVKKAGEVLPKVETVLANTKAATQADDASAIQLVDKEKLPEKPLTLPAYLKGLKTPAVAGVALPASIPQEEPAKSAAKKQIEDAKKAVNDMHAAVKATLDFVAKQNGFAEKDNVCGEVSKVMNAK